MTQSVAGSTTTSYSDDGSNLRVIKGATTYIYSGSKVIAEYVSGTLSKEYIYSGSKLLASIAGTAVTYHHADHLSNRVETDASGTVTRTFGHLPFGDIWYETGTPDKWTFTSYERDSAESGFDYAMFRYYGSRYGRFISPDRLAGSRENPQSLNRYAYVFNDPVNAVDPLGLLTNCTQYHLENCGFPIAGGPDIWISLGTGIPMFFAGSGRGSGGGGGIDAARHAARQLLSDKDCADFLKAVMTTLGLRPDLDTFLQNFDKLTIVPTPPGDHYGTGAAAHVDPRTQYGAEAAATTIHVDNSTTPWLPEILLHEGLHTYPYSFDDLDLAHAAGEMTDVTKRTTANENKASQAFSDEMAKHCIPPGVRK